MKTLVSPKGSCARLGVLGWAVAAVCALAWVAMSPAALAASPTAAGATVVPLSAMTAGRPASTVPIVSGDLIVKFRDASEAGVQLAAVLAGQRTVASVSPLATRLSSELGVPLVLVQVTSGREALLALDRAALTRALVAQAEREPSVRKASAAPANAVPGSGAASIGTSGAVAPVLPSAELVLRLELRTEAMRSDLAQRLDAAGLLAPRIRMEPGGSALRASYDIDALTLALIARLQQRSDVEYVQPNRLLRTAPAASR